MPDGNIPSMTTPAGPRAVAITGASGLIGTALTKDLRDDGVRVVHLVRRAAAGPDEIEWRPGIDALDPAALSGIDAVVHLAGAGIQDKRWTDEYKRTLLESRVDTTRAIAEAIAGSGPDGPRILVSGSAVGYYGDTGERTVAETAPSGEGYLALICREWEAAASPAIAAGVRVVFLRTGLVLSRSGGLLGKLKPLFKLGLGGRLGSGRQYQPWISLVDEVRAIRFALVTDALSGPVNATGPTPVTNRELTRELGRAAHRPALAIVPAPALRIALGEFADEGVLVGQRAVPAALLSHGFVFEHATLGEALTWAFAKDQPR
ncbi:MAG: multidrug transporter [Pseudonocardiales bacterium]|nr:multidrug transporter [Pseudonocardiales bacterium]